MTRPEASRRAVLRIKLVLTLLYRREYRSMENIAAEYGVSRDTIADNIHWVERALLNANRKTATVPPKPTETGSDTGSEDFVSELFACTVCAAGFGGGT